jgi:NAD(P)-dependent dehydrogenase (short-subunit alcohol dehydrogenase family)
MSKHWFVTGASSGIGRHLSEIILAAGDELTATARRPESVNDLAVKYPGQLTVERLDVTAKSDIAPVVSRAQKRRPVDILVNNAGGGVIGATEEMSDAEIDGQIALNLMAPVYITRAFIAAMRERQSGRIIQISSASGQGSLPTSSMYHAAKWGLEGFSGTPPPKAACTLDV